MLSTWIPASVLQTAGVISGYLFCSLAILQLGRFALARIGLAGEPMARTERAAAAWVLGSAGFSLLILALAAMHAIDRWILVLAGAVCIGAGGLRQTHARTAAPSRPSVAERFARVTIAIFLAVCFVAAMAPSDDSDGYRYHLGFPHLYRAAGGLIPIRTDFYSAFPQGMEMLYLYALEFGGFSAANLLHWNFLAALAATMCAFGMRRGYPVAGASAAAAVCASSVVVTTTASASVDTALAAALFVSFHAWLRWRDDGGRGWLLLGSIAAGFGCAVKYTGLTALVVSALILAASRRRSWKQAAVAVVAAGVLIAPWLLKNWLYFQNPVFPFRNSWFPNPYLLPSTEAAWIANLRHFNGASFDLSYPWEATIRGVTPMGFTGPFFLLTPLGFLALRTPTGRWTLAAAAVTAMPWLFGNPIARFAIPALPFLALAIGLGLAGVLRARAAHAVLGLCVAVQAVMDFPPFIERWNKQWIIALKEIPWRRALRLEEPRQYWRRTLPGYAVVEFAEASLPPEARILSFEEQHQFFTTRILANPYASEDVSTAASILDRAADIDRRLSVRCAASFARIPARSLRLVQRSAHPESPWTVFEVRIPGAAIAESDAVPNPWESGLASDGNEVTAWSSKEPRHDGMRLEVRLEGRRPVFEVEYLTSLTEGGRVELAWSDDGRLWEPIDAEFQCAEFRAEDLFRRSTRELKRRRWSYLLGTAERPWLRDALAEPGKWSVQILYRNGPVHLLAIE